MKYKSPPEPISTHTPRQEQNQLQHDRVSQITRRLQEKMLRIQPILIS
jgi:hypothetical protein